ncbi:hypothetical protein Tco_0205254 [Tanacetum coccineum]
MLVASPRALLVSSRNDIAIILLQNICVVNGEVRIRQKSQENRQKRANTDTRTEECARAGSQSQKVNPQSKSTLEDKDPKVSNSVP